VGTKPDKLKALVAERLTVANLTDDDFTYELKQKGVDMRIGLDIASLALKKQVDTIVLIAGDADFVPAAKMARREGLKFVLDPMHNKISAKLSEHVDRIWTVAPKNGVMNETL
jgi:uncharacterized LabA/DUF88 family protein